MTAVPGTSRPAQPSRSPCSPGCSRRRCSRCCRRRRPGPAGGGSQGGPAGHQASGSGRACVITSIHGRSLRRRGRIACGPELDERAPAQGAGSIAHPRVDVGVEDVHQDPVGHHHRRSAASTVTASARTGCRPRSPGSKTTHPSIQVEHHLDDHGPAGRRGSSATWSGSGVRQARVTQQTGSWSHPGPWPGRCGRHPGSMSSTAPRVVRVTHPAYSRASVNQGRTSGPARFSRAVARQAGSHQCRQRRACPNTPSRPGQSRTPARR